MYNVVVMELQINGIKVTANYTTDTINSIFMPLLANLTALQKQENKRIIVYLAAPPGCGKSTLASYLERLSIENGYTPIQALGMDGFHHTNIYLNSHYRKNTGELLALHKGAPDTFNLESLREHICFIKEGKETYWPIYDRKIHNPIENAIKVDSSIILIEGNYLLLNDEPWNKLKDYADYTIFITGEPIDLENRLINRKMQSGSSFETALKHYHETDKPNLLLVNQNHLPADLTLKLNISDKYHVSFTKM